MSLGNILSMLNIPKSDLEFGHFTLKVDVPHIESKSNLGRQRRIVHGKVETPIHDSVRELVTSECKEHGVKS
jgi:hypothetical protein